MAIVDGGYRLSEKLSRYIFLETASPPDVSQEVPASAEFHDKDQMAACLERIVKPYYVLVPSRVKNEKLLLKLLLLSCVSLDRRDELLIDGLDCNKLLCQSVHG